jgi:ATP-dependent DNA helicase RecQ
LELARQKQLPPYCICHDSTLKQIAQIAPRNLEALEMVKGMGGKKVEHVWRGDSGSAWGE